MTELKLISLLGWFTMIVVAWMISYNRKLFPWRTVVWGVGLQFTLALLILKTPWGAEFFVFAGKVVQKLIQFSNEGCKFVFGPLADSDLLTEKFGPANSVIFAILVTGTIIIVASISSLLYHWGILQKVVQAAAWVMRKIMRTSGSETLSACANIFMGQTEAPLMIRPYVPRLTHSELMTIMVCGMAHIAGGVAAVYAALGRPGRLSKHRRTSAHRVGAELSRSADDCESSPAGNPAKRNRRQRARHRATHHGQFRGRHLPRRGRRLPAFDQRHRHAHRVHRHDGDGELPGQLAASESASASDTLQTIFGWFNAPFAWLMGVPAQDCLAVGQILGERIVLNEFVGYLDLTLMRSRSSSTPAASPSPPTRCAASRIFRALRFRSAASARSRRNAAAKWPGSASARCLAACSPAT